MTQDPRWRVTQVDRDRVGDIVVHAASTALPAICPRCGSQRRPSRHGALSANYRDAPFVGRQVSIAVDVQRFRCSDCGQAFLQNLPDMDGRRRITARCAVYVIDQVMARDSLRDVANIVGIDEKGVRNVFDDRGLIFTVGDPPSGDRFVCESCLGIHPKSEHRLAPAKHFGKWRSDELLREANVCRECFNFAADPWRAGIVRRI